jgi:hypothetical protein
MALVPRPFAAEIAAKVRLQQGAIAIFPKGSITNARNAGWLLKRFQIR